jgi:hypothetical protein
VTCFTPVESPESKQHGQGLRQTFKRDYVRVSPIADLVRIRPIGWRPSAAPGQKQDSGDRIIAQRD